MKKLTVGLLILALLTLWLLWGNTALEVNTWVIESEKIPSSFDGFRIAQVSDLHNADFWEEVVAALAEVKPDIIVLTGDLIDSGKTDVEAALSFAERAAAIAPCFTAEKHNDIPRLRRFTIYHFLSRTADNKARFQTLCLISLMIHFVYDTRSKTDLISVGREPCCRSLRDNTLR